MILRTRGVTRIPSHKRSSPAPKMTPHVGVQLAHVDTIGVKVVRELRVAFFEQRHHQVLGTDVIMVVVTAFLFGNAQDA